MTHENLQIDSAAITDKGLSEKRPQNEDSYLELRDSGLYAVADGVGGAQAGDVASQMAVEILGEAFINLQEDGDAEERMQMAISQANSSIYQTANELAQLSTMATTVVALHINGNIATIGHVGDSRLYRLDESGNLFRETQDHSIVEEEVRAGRMTPEQALTHPSRNVISRALGAEHTVEIDMKTIMFEPNTKFLVCSDGVTRHIPDEEIRSLLMENQDSSMACQTIKNLCYERGALDNLTAVVVSSSESAVAFSSETTNITKLEEDTVASSRPSLVNGAVFRNSDLDGKDFDTQQLEIPDGFQSEEIFDTQDLEAEDEITFPTEFEKEDRNSISIEPHESISNLQNESIAKKDIKSYRVDDKGGIGILGTIISSILWLLIGILVGAGGYYLWMKSTSSGIAGQAQPTSSVQLISFEQKRRVVDNDPAQYIANNVNPKDAGDHYFLGRANILTGNFDSAKKELVIAQEKLAEVTGVNKKVLENDISIALGKIASSDNEKEIANSSKSSEEGRTSIGDSIETNP